MSIKNDDSSGTLNVPSRDVSIPAFLSDTAQLYLMPQPAPEPYPAIEDKAGWREYVAATTREWCRFFA